MSRSNRAVTDATDVSESISSTEIEQLKAQAQADLDAKSAPAADEPVTETVATKTAYVMPVNPDSIRQIIRTMLLAGSSTKDIAAVLAERKPGTAAALKSVKHIAYYRAQLKKEAKQA